MRIALDVGNTETVVGVARSDDVEPVQIWRIATVADRTGDEVAFLLRSLLREAGHEPEELNGAILGSVVPSMSRVLLRALDSMVGSDVLLLSGSSELDIELAVDDPATVGADRIANALATSELYGRHAIVVDLGTATTFDCVRDSGTFEGGVIAPGILAGLEWLSKRTAMLPDVDFAPPRRVIGTRTETCMRSGVFYSAIDSIDGMVQRIAEEWDAPDPIVVATGGHARLVGPHCSTVEEIAPQLTLTGLFIAGRRLL